MQLKALYLTNQSPPPYTCSVLALHSESLYSDILYSPVEEGIGNQSSLFHELEETVDHGDEHAIALYMYFVIFDDLQYLRDLRQHYTTWTML